jgi:uncharacterized membrane protein YcfT
MDDGTQNPLSKSLTPPIGAEWRKKSIADFQKKRIDTLRWFIGPSVAMLIIASILESFELLQFLTIPLIIFGIGLFATGCLRLTCRVCKKSVLREHIGGNMFDPQVCMHCGADLKEKN